MAFYSNSNQNSAITSVESSPVSDGNFTFFYVDPAKKDEVKTWLTSQDVGQELVADTELNGKAVLITQGQKSSKEIMQTLEDHGDHLQLVKRDKKFNAWLWRGLLSMTGHPMQLISSFMLVEPFNAKKEAHINAPEKKIVISGGEKFIRKDFDIAKGVFAVSNLLANLTNIFFGAQKSPDINHLRLLKGEINDMMDEHLVPGEKTFDIDDKRAPLRHGPVVPKSMGEKFHGFMQRNSVMLGEIGLRYFGGISLVAPMKWQNWKKGAAHLGSGEFKKAFASVRNPDQFIFRAGSFWLAGKTLAFFSKTPDPYDPKPKSTWDKIRENYIFKVSTVTEAVGSTTMAYDSYSHRKLTSHGKVYTDYLGSVGGMLFTTAFAMRFFAPFGEKELNMEEVNAHIADTLAKTPPEKVPQLMAEAAATVKEHLKNKPLEFGEIYTKMMTDLYRYHHINIQADPNKPLASHEPVEASKDATPQLAEQKFDMVEQKLDKPIARSPLDRVATPAASHTAEAVTRAAAAGESAGISV